MQEITGALIGIGLVLTAVFLPMAFFGGSTGVIYRQFSVTIVSAMSLSIMVALGPDAVALRHPAQAGGRRRSSAPCSGWRRFFGWFNRNFDSTSATGIASDLDLVPATAPGS